MKCYICHQEMERGHLITINSPGLFFMPPERGTRDLGLLYFSAERRVKECGGVIVDGPYLSRFSKTDIPAFLCRHCRNVVLSYENAAEAESAAAAEGTGGATEDEYTQETECAQQAAPGQK